jgi:hypothetical protein
MCFLRGTDRTFIHHFSALRAPEGEVAGRKWRQKGTYYPGVLLGHRVPGG